MEGSKRRADRQGYHPKETETDGKNSNLKTTHIKNVKIIHIIYLRDLANSWHVRFTVLDGMLFRVSSRLDRGGKGVLIVKFDMLMDSELGDLKGKLEVFVEERLEVRLCGSTVKMLFDPLISYHINLLQVWKVEEVFVEE
ncbi:hypothetical protein Syun_028053 [Stephania yunnanensis]|uniref:Uncharacterized protein n=1 Tax=Stephania yunnanensis TaxID=152371 RepID=A0AAP0EK09_9MAGN